MKIISVNEYDIVNYKKPSMFVIFPYCSFKCGYYNCQNKALANEETIEIEAAALAEKYTSNPLTKAIVCGGLEPFDSFQDLFDLVHEIRKLVDDEIVIYSGYDFSEINERAEKIMSFDNVIIKFGRYLPSREKYYNARLGVELASDNQYIMCSKCTL